MKQEDLPPEPKRYNINLVFIILLAVSLALNAYFMWFMYNYKTATTYDISSDRFFFGTSGKRICAHLQANNWFEAHPRAKDACELINSEF
jgi:hypothetical protein